MADFLSGLLRQPDKPTLAGLLRQPTPNPLAAALQSPGQIWGALRDPQFYQDAGTRLADLLRGGVQDVLPTGAGPIMARQGYQADPAYMQKMSDVGLAGMTVFHGSPYKFDKFDMSKIGTGEGAQAYGHGLYFAESPSTARSYQEKLSQGKPLLNGEVADSSKLGLSPEAKKIFDYNLFNNDPARIERFARQGVPEYVEAWNAINNKLQTNTGNMYRVDLPDEHIAKMLDWDKPLSQQSQTVKDSIVKLTQKDTPLTGEYAKRIKYMLDNNGTLDSAHSVMGQDLVTLLGADKEGVNVLRQAGIPGIRYLDGGSRGSGAGTSNFVVFDDALPKIVGRE